MSERADQTPTGTELLDLQLAMMRETMAWMATGPQRLMLGMAAALGKAPAGLQWPQPGQLASASKDYALRVQEDVDSILHAFAMAPVAADRLIRTAALGREGPARTSVRPPRAAARGAKAAPARRRASKEHAR